MTTRDPNDLSSDPTSVMSAAGPASRRPAQVEVVPAATPGTDAKPLGPGAPDGMHRAEDDIRARATSPDFSEHPAHVVTGTRPAGQADSDQGADVVAERGDGRPPAGGGSSGRE